MCNKATQKKAKEKKIPQKGVPKIKNPYITTSSYRGATAHRKRNDRKQPFRRRCRAGVCLREVVPLLLRKGTPAHGGWLLASDALI